MLTKATGCVNIMLSFLYERGTIMENAQILEWLKQVRSEIDCVIASLESDTPNNPNSNASSALETRITKFLIEIGIKPNLKGFRCIREALLFDTDIMQVTKKLYPEVAQKLKTTGQRVERNIRYSVGRAWEESNHDFWDNFNHIPTNFEFLAMARKVLVK